MPEVGINHNCLVYIYSQPEVDKYGMFNDVPILSNGFQEKSIFYSRVTLLHEHVYNFINMYSLPLHIQYIYIICILYHSISTYTYYIYILYIYIYIYNIIYIYMYIYAIFHISMSTISCIHLVHPWKLHTRPVASMDHCGILQLENDVLI